MAKNIQRILHGVDSSGDQQEVRVYDDGAGGYTLVAASGTTDISDRAGRLLGIVSLPVGTAAMAASTPVTIASDDTLAVAIRNALQVMDDWDESDRAKINPIVGQAGIAAGSGAADATTPRVISATDDPGVANLAAMITPASTTLAEVAAGAEVDDTYYYYVDMTGYHTAAFQFILNGGAGSITVTMEATLQDDGTAQAACTYVDVTSGLFGVANTTASTIWVIDTPVLAKYLRLKVVAASGADNGAWTIYERRMF